MMFIGLMGLGSDGMLYAPGGRRLCRVPFWLGRIIQATQHKVARQTHH